MSSPSIGTFGGFTGHCNSAPSIPFVSCKVIKIVLQLPFTILLEYVGHFREYTNFSLIAHYRGVSRGGR